LSEGLLARVESISARVPARVLVAAYGRAAPASPVEAGAIRAFT